MMALVPKHQLNQLRDNPATNRTRGWKSCVIAVAASRI